MGKMASSFAPGTLFPQMPEIHFQPEHEKCPDCNVKLKVQKTRSKTVVTMDIGAFISKESVLECPHATTAFTSKQLRSLVPQGCTFGFDVLVYVGKALFLLNRSEKEIIQDLADKNISISDREIGYLGKKFIVYLALAHRYAGEKLKKIMALRGGYMLHLDGTCEGDSPFLFTGLEEISEIVLDNIKIPSENAEYLIPFLQQIKQTYGQPISVIHDMCKGIMLAVETVFPDVPDFICHFHFLRDIGKDLFEDEYKQIRNCLRKIKIRGSLREKLKYLRPIIRENKKVVTDLKDSINKGSIETSFFKRIPMVAAYALIYWIFDAYNESDGYGFPFDRPHLLFYQRIQLLHHELMPIMKIHLRDESKDNKHLYLTWKLLERVMCDTDLKKSVAQIEKKMHVFDELRKALHIALPNGKKGLNDEGEQTDIRTIEEKVKEFRKWITTDKRFSGQIAYKKLIEQIDKYWEKLFSDPIGVNTPNGQVYVQPQRTNNILERFFRNIKRKFRKKTGTGSLNKTLKNILADTPLVMNLNNKEYVKILLNGCSNLEELFSNIDHKLVLEELRKIKENKEMIPPEIKNIIKHQNLPQKISTLFTAHSK